MVSRRALYYVLIWLLGSITVLVTVSYYKASTIQKVLETADSMLAENKAAQILEDLENSSLWEPLFPGLIVRRQCLALRCYVRTDNLPEAENIAAKLLNASLSEKNGNGIDPNAFILERIARIIEIPFTRMLDRKFRKENMRARYSNWIGYTFLIEELRLKKDTKSLARVKDTIAAASPSSDLIKYIDKLLSITLNPNRNQAKPPASTIPGWGLVTAEEARIYNSAGEFCETAPRGTLIEITSMKQTKSGEVAYCVIHARDKSTPDMVIMASDLDVRTGRFSTLRSNVVALFKERSGVMTELAAAKQRMNEESARRNPFSPQYDAARSEYSEFKKNIEPIRERYRKATGTDRDSLADQLRMLKSKDVMLTERLRSAKKSYDEWNSRKVSTSPQTESLQLQLTRIESQLQALHML